LLPQEFREVLKNALEAVERRMASMGLKDGGRIEFDVDWPLHKHERRWFVSCADNGKLSKALKRKNKDEARNKRRHHTGFNNKATLSWEQNVEAILRS